MRNHTSPEPRQWRPTRLNRSGALRAGSTCGADAPRAETEAGSATSRDSSDTAADAVPAQANATRMETKRRRGKVMRGHVDLRANLERSRTPFGSQGVRVHADTILTASEMAFLRPFFLVAAVFGLALGLAHTAAPQGADERPRVLAVEFENDVNPVTADYLIGEIERANEENYDAVVLLTDTPGGLDTAMRDIIKAELASKVAVIQYVYPPGSRSASAGVFLAMAADVAAMAPGTNIGSSTPILSSGQDIPDDLHDKVVNDAAAYIGELAKTHGRNEQWARDAVTKASNVGATEALELGVVDYVAPDLPTLLDEIDGTTTKPKGIVLNTADAEIDTVEMGFWKQLLDVLVDPNLIVLLMSIGLLGITIEVMNPGLILPGTRRRDLADHGPVRPPGAADQLGGRPPDPDRLRVLRRRGVHHEPRRARDRRRSQLRDRRAAPLRSRGRRLPGLDLGRARDRGHARARRSAWRSPR